MKVLKKVEYILLGLAISLLAYTGVTFLWFNESIINNYLLGIISFILCLTIMIGSNVLNILKPRLKIPKLRIINFVVAVITFVVAVVLILNSAVIDFFQPFAIFEPYIYSLSVAVVLYFISQSIAIFTKTKNMGALGIGISILLMFLFTDIWNFSQGYGEFDDIDNTIKVFEEGENYYSSFRIPSLVSIPKENLNGKDGNNLSNDLLVAFVEGRKDNSLDIGDIDVVSKVSIDGGRTWSKMDTFLSWENISGTKGSSGRVGDPTVIFNKFTNKIMLYCNAGGKNEDYKLNVYLIEGTVKNNGEIIWDYSNVKNLNNLTTKNSLVGPGKAAVLPSGRTIFSFREDGQSKMAYSDDNAKTWKIGETAGEGDESEIISLGGNDLMLISRIGNMSTFPRNNYLRFAFSNNGGESFKTKLTESTLKSPICMASIAKFENEIFCSYPDSLLTRANLSIATTKDMGKTWTSKRLYNGPSGYSIITTDSNGTKYIIAEIGKVEYNEEIRLFIVK